MKNVWIHNLLTEAGTDCGSSHLGKGCNHFADGLNDRRTII